MGRDRHDFSGAAIQGEGREGRQDGTEDGGPGVRRVRDCFSGERAEQVLWGSVSDAGVALAERGDGVSEEVLWRLELTGDDMEVVCEALLVYGLAELDEAESFGVKGRQRAERAHRQESERCVELAAWVTDRLEGLTTEVTPAANLRVVP